MAPKTLSQKEVAQYLLKLRNAADSFEGFVRLIQPDWVMPSFQLELIRTLDALERDQLDCDNLLITMPPRHSKSAVSTVLFPSYYMARNPQRFVMSCSYNAELSKDFGRQIRDIVQLHSVQQTFPDFLLSNESRAADTWRTESGGSYFAVGLGGTTSGRPANCFAADTPVHTPQGVKPIHEIQVGDFVMSYNHRHNKVELKPVVATLIKQATTKTYAVNNWIFRATADHPVLTGKGYLPLEKVTSKGHKVFKIQRHLTTNKTNITETTCTHVGHGRREPVYDIQVEDNHNFFAAGILAHNCLIVDDPVKSREDADSITKRNKTWNYYASALSTRLQPQSDGTKPKQLIILTRWHPDDLAGRLMATDDWAEGRWKHINFPAIENKKTKLLKRWALPETQSEYLPFDKVAELPEKERRAYLVEEQSLWPERFPLEDLKRRERLNPREFAALYQQKPYIEGGNLIKTEWWQQYPSDLRPENFQSLIITVDTAFKKNEQADYSVAVTAGIDRSGDIYLVDIMRGRYDFPELKQRLIRLNTQWRGKGLRAMYVEDKASGQSLIQELKRESGISVIPYKVANDKVSRVNAILPIIEGGRVFIPEEAPWLDNFIDECVTFPNGTHDDQVDATTMAIDVLSRTAISPEAYSLYADPTQSLNNNQPDYGKSLFKTVAGKARNWSGWGT